jgi:hydrogenase-4 component B
MKIIVVASLLMPFAIFLLQSRFKYIYALAIIVGASLPLIYTAIQVLYTGLPLAINLSIPGFQSPELIIDCLSSFFILTITFTIITGMLYAQGYLRKDKHHPAAVLVSVHYFSLIWLYFSMIFLCIVRDGLGFLIGWELMTLSSFLLVIYRASDKEVMLAGTNYLIQMHIGFIFLLTAFLLIQSRTGILGFSGLSRFSALQSARVPIFLFFISFGIKAGFVPFHSWLPEAHPAAPSHVSGIMSGVMIKMGIYGILRVITYMKGDFLAPGITMLAIALISSVYGVMQAIMQHDLKRLLAWHSIENIGIIGIGIGIGLIGQAKGLLVLAFLGYTGAILHVLNHSLFKSLLFYTTGSVYLATGRKIINQLGGLIKKMPWTAILFLIAAIAICGLPPFNGFISEFLIFSGLFTGLKSSDPAFVIIFLISIIGLAFTGGLALFCFTKAFGITFLGSQRSKYTDEPSDPSAATLLPQLLIAFIIILIGILPLFFVKWCGIIIHSSFGLIIPQETQGFSLVTLKGIQIGSISFILISGMVFLIRKYALRNRKTEKGPTWACGYTAINSKMQYTATSFASEYAKLSKPIIYQVKEYYSIKHEKLFPSERKFAIHAYDNIQRKLISIPATFITSLFRRMAVLQTGKMQNYIMYALIFLLICLILSLRNLI